MCESTPLVSIIIPVYNGENYLHKAVNSVLGQTYRGWELILVNDGSTDASGAICDAYAQSDPRIRVIHTPNHGLASARNCGMSQACGEWIFFLDCDDWIESNAIEVLLSYSAGADVVMGDYPEKVLPWRSIDRARVYSTSNLTVTDLSELFFIKMFHPVWNKLYRRESIFCRFEDGLFLIEDVVFNLQNWKHWRRIAVVPNVTYHYVTHETSLSRTFRIDRMKLVQRSFMMIRNLLGECDDVMLTMTRWYIEELYTFLAQIAMSRELEEIKKQYLSYFCLANCANDLNGLSREMMNTWHGQILEYLLDGDLDTLLASFQRMNKPLISVIIPIYNTEQYLPRAIESVRQQTYANWELWLIDDGSTDNSGLICDQYMELDARIHALHIDNGGSSHARNVGLNHAAGDWVLFVDSDDLLEPNTLTIMQSFAMDVDVVIGHYPGQSAPWKKVEKPTIFDLEKLTQQDLSNLFYMRMFHSPINKLFRRSSINVPFRTDVSYIDDVTFLLSNFEHWRKVVILPDDTYRYMERPNSLTHAFRMDRMEQVRTSFRLFSKMFPVDSDVMNTLSRWYVIELRLFLLYYTNGNIPDDVKQLMVYIGLDDSDFDHRQINTVLLNEELHTFWDAVLTKDIPNLINMLASIQ